MPETIEPMPANGANQAEDRRDLQASAQDRHRGDRAQFSVVPADVQRVALSLTRRLVLRLPSGLEPRVRVLFACWALLFCAVTTLSLLGQPTPGRVRLLAAVSIVHFVVSIVRTERRSGSPLASDLLLDGLALIGVTVALGVPTQVLSLMYPLLLYRSAVGPTWRFAVTIPVFSAAYLVGVALSQSPELLGMHWQDGVVLSMVPACSWPAASSACWP